jgi:hypothetical protein
MATRVLVIERIPLAVTNRAEDSFLACQFDPQLKDIVTNISSSRKPT